MITIFNSIELLQSEKASIVTNELTFKVGTVGEMAKMSWHGA